MKAKKRAIKFLKFIFLIAGLSLIFLALFRLLNDDFLRVNQVTCFEDNRPCQSDLWFKINTFVLGKNIIFLSPQEIAQKIKDELVQMDQVEIKKKLPNSLIVYLSRRKPIAIIEAKNEYWEADYQGIILSKPSQLSNLPLIVTDELLTTDNGKKIESPSVLASLEFLYRLLFKNIEVRRLEATKSQQLTLYLKQKPEVIVSFDRDQQKQVDSLQLILQRAKIEGKQIELIDLRFDKPVISYREK